MYWYTGKPLIYSNTKRQLPLFENIQLARMYVMEHNINIE